MLDRLARSDSHQNAEFISIFYGEDVSQEQAQEILSFISINGENEAVLARLETWQGRNETLVCGLAELKTVAKHLGGFGVESFTPVINPPQTGILGVCTTVQRPRKGADGSIQLYPAMALSLTYDHRAIDGAPASRFVQELCKQLEHFTVLLAK